MIETAKAAIKQKSSVFDPISAFTRNTVIVVCVCALLLGCATHSEWCGDSRTNFDG